MNHKLQVKSTGYKCYSSPFSVIGETSSWTSSRANKACCARGLCPMSPETPLQHCNHHNSPSVMPSALSPPWLLVSKWCISSKSLHAAVVVWPRCRRVGCRADVHGLGRSDVVGLSPVLHFTSFFISGIAMFLRVLLFCLLCLTFPTKALTDRQTNGRHRCIRLVPLGNQARNRNILGALGEMCGFQAFTSLKTDTHLSCWACIGLQWLPLSRSENWVFQPRQHLITVVTALANCKAKQLLPFKCHSFWVRLLILFSCVLMCTCKMVKNWLS